MVKKEINKGAGRCIFYKTSEEMVGHIFIKFHLSREVWNGVL
jgi:hypothetical protein